MSLLLVMFEIKSQIRNPRIWYVGYQASLKTDTNSLDTGFQRQWGATVMDFRSNPPFLGRNGYALSCPYTQVYDQRDSLILYSNGSKVFNGKHRLIEGADSLSYGTDWQSSPFAGTYFANYNIAIYPTAMVCLPSVANPNQYYLISIFINPDTTNYKLVYSIVDMSLNNGRGKMIKKEVPLKFGDFTETISACRHGNGRDWWLIAREYHKKNYTIMKLDSTGLHIQSENQLSAWEFSDVTMTNRNLISKMSWGGNLFASSSYKGLELYDFDRCKGILSNRREYPIPNTDTAINFSVCFTRDDKLLYFNSTNKIYQLDIANNFIQKVADLKPYYDSTDDGKVLPIPAVFGFSQLAPDNKIYYCTTNSSRHLSVIDNPSIVGVGCNVKQQFVKVLTWTNNLPSFPNYELGAVSGTCAQVAISTIPNTSIAIYPNPATDYIHIQLKEIPTSSISIVVYDMLGRKMYHQALDKTTLTQTILTQDWSEGIYYLRLIDENETQVYQTKIEIRK